VTEEPSLGIALATVRPDEVSEFVASVLRQPTRPAYLSVRHQGSPDEGAALGQRLAGIATEHGYDGLVFGSGSERGASRGRNAAFRALPESVTWVWTPNDTSRPPDDWTTSLRHHVTGVDVSVAAVALDYRVDGRWRRQVSDVPELSGWSLWRAIEPALVWRREAVLDLDGFDVTLGTGADGWPQSGEGTDLLCRLHEAGYAVVTLPLPVQGRSQHLSTSSRDRRRKDFYYGVGFGLVARRHFPLGRSLAAVASPLLKLLTGRSVEGERLGPGASLTTSAGRAAGLILGERSVRLRMRGEHWT
jgi:hypothetical protein